MAQIRFRDLVARAGKPEVVTLWSVPGPKDPFSEAVKQNRVITIRQDRQAADFGEAGFHPSPHASYLLFPKPLAIRTGDKVVGIKYDLMGAGRAAGAAQMRSAKAGKPAQPREAVKSLPPPKPMKVVRRPRPVPVEKEFEVRFQRTARVESSMSVRARTKAAAVEKAKARTADWAFDLAGATIDNQVSGVTAGKDVAPGEEQPG